MKISIDTTFETREELDSFIRSRVGEDPNINIKHELEISLEEATKLALDKDSKVFGVRVLVKEPVIDKNVIK